MLKACEQHVTGGPAEVPQTALKPFFPYCYDSFSRRYNGLHFRQPSTIVQEVKAPSPVQRHAKNLFSKLEKVTDQIESNPTPETVHRLRTTIARLQTLLSAAGEPNPKLGKRLSRVRRLAGKIRDIDVQTDALRRIRMDSRRDKAAVLRALAETHSKRIRKLTKALQEELAAGLLKRLKRVLAELTATAQVSGEAKDYTALSVDAFARLAQDYAPLSPANLHDFRVACKRVRYEAEMAQQSPQSRAVIMQLKRIQDAIGEWHDWQRLIETADEFLATPASPLLSLLRAHRQSKFSEAVRITHEAKQALLSLRSPALPKKSSASTSDQTTTKMAASAS
jgi:CHAD domain-containing protein